MPINSTATGWAVIDNGVTATTGFASPDHVVIDGIVMTIGAKMSIEQIAHLPIGTVMRAGDGSYSMTLEAGDVWRGTNGGEYHTHRLSSDYNILVSVPPQEPTRVAVDPELARFQRDFRNSIHAITTERYGADFVRDVIEPALDSLMAPTISPDLPVGSVVMHRDPSAEDFAVFTRTEEGWSNGFDETHSPTCCTLVSEDPSPRTIEEFKARAWAEAWRLKVANRWCSGLIRILGEFGITGPCLNLRDYELVSARDRDRLPEGAVVGNVHGDTGLFLKQGHRWLRLLGGAERPLGSVRLLHLGGSMGVRAQPLMLTECAPGSVVETEAGDFAKRSDGDWDWTRADESPVTSDALAAMDPMFTWFGIPDQDTPATAGSQREGAR